MTEIANEGPAEPALPPDPSHLQFPDPHLTTLAALSNRANLELGLRLFVGGLVLSGTLVGGDKFFDLMADAVRNPEAGEGENAFADMYAEIADEYRARAADENDASWTEYIHLRDAWSHSPGQNPLIVGQWRGRLSRIDGWALGTYGQNE